MIIDLSHLSGQRRNEKLLFEVHTKITKIFDYVWFLIQSEGDKSKWRYQSPDTDIIRGIAEYLNLVKVEPRFGHLISPESLLKM